MSSEFSPFPLYIRVCYRVSMNYNPYIIGVIRDDDGMEIDDRYVLYKYRDFTSSESVKRFALDNYVNHFDSLCCDSDKCREMKNNWSFFCDKMRRASNECGTYYKEGIIKNCLSSMYNYIIKLNANIKACRCCDNSTICDIIERDVEHVRAQLLLCMAHCGVEV